MTYDRSRVIMVINNNNNEIYLFRVELLVKTLFYIIALTRHVCNIQNRLQYKLYMYIIK